MVETTYEVQIEKLIKSSSYLNQRSLSVEYSIPVSVKRGEKLYDAFFLCKKSNEEKDMTISRPFAWGILAADNGPEVSFNWCNITDFVRADRFPLDKILTKQLPNSLSAKEKKEAEQNLSKIYESMKLFMFEDKPTVQQMQYITDYKRLFLKLVYTDLYPFYYALSPDFFSWIKLPLPSTAVPVAEKENQEILREIKQLSSQFARKIATDHQKQAVFDEMHSEIQRYRNGLLDDLTRPLERDIITMIDDLQKSITAFEQEEPSVFLFEKIFTHFRGVEQDLTDILYRQGIDPYTLGSEQINLPRQKIITTVPTNDVSKDKTVAERLTLGWEKKGRIVRPEHITAYLYQEEPVES